MKEAESNFRRESRRLQRKGWRDFTSEVSSLAISARLAKVMKLGKKQSLGTIKNKMDHIQITLKSHWKPYQIFISQIEMIILKLIIYQEILLRTLALTYWKIYMKNQ